MTFHVASEPFKGIQHRERVSLGREWDWRLVTIAAGASLSDAIDVRFSAGIAVTVDPTVTNGYLVVYSAHELAGAYSPVQDKNGTLLIATATAGRTVVFPAEVFPLGYIKLGSCNSSGTLLAEVATRVHTVMLKP
jgi:hypothetical protein